MLCVDFLCGLKIEITPSQGTKWALSLIQQSPVIMLAPCLGQGQRSSYTNSWESRAYYRLSADITLTSGKQKTISWLSLYYVWFDKPSGSEIMDRKILLHCWKFMVIIPFDVRFLELVLFRWGVYLLLRWPSHLFMPVDRFKTLVFGID